MKIDFSPRLFRDPSNPLGQGAGAAAGATPWGAIAQGAIGLAQTAVGWIRQGKYTNKYERLINSYKPNQSILDYYTKALEGYNVNPYQSAMYRESMQGAGRGLATGIGALQDRRSALAGVGGLVQGYNDASLRAAAAAEGQRAQALGQLGQATGMKAQEEKYKFEALAGLYGAKATGGANIMNAGLSNIGGVANTYSQMQMLKQQYG